MKIVLANGPWLEEGDKYGLRAGSRWPHVRLKKEQLQYYPFPFYLAGAAAVAQAAGHAVTLRDCIAAGTSSGQFLNELATLKPQLVLLETSTPSIKNDLAMAAAVKRVTGAVVVMAGTHATALPAECLAEPAVDYVVRYEYDYVLRNLLEALQAGRDPSGLGGLALRRADGAVQVNESEPKIPDLDAIPWPLREGLPMHKYNDPFCKQAPNVAMMASRGCPYACTFCVEPTVFYDGSNYRKRSPANIVDEMEHCIREYGAREIYFDDSSFSVDQDQVLAICAEIQRRGLKISWSAMADAHLKPDTLKVMRAAGCVALKFGLESSDAKILRNVKKHINLDMCKKMVQASNAIGIETHATYIFGLPGETRETLKATTDFAFKLGTTTAQFALIIPIPGTVLFDQAKANGWLTTLDWEAYDGCHGAVISYPGLNGDELLAAVRNARKKLIWKVLFNPPQLLGYLRMTKQLAGWKGLWELATEKTSYLLGGA